MERENLMMALEYRALAYRVGLSALCARAGVSRTVAYRWKSPKGRVVPTLETIGRLERKLDEIVAERSQT